MPSPSTVTRIDIAPQGALISSFIVGGQNILQTFPAPGLFPSHNAPYFSETIGRVSNRIGGARARNLNGKDYPLSANEGTNCLHGGKVGWGKRTWQGPQETTRHGDKAQLWTYTSPDGEEGFPGTVEARVWYTIEALPDRGTYAVQLDAEYEVEMTGNEVDETVVAVTNHAYFNPSSKPTIDGLIVDFATIDHLPVDKDQIPTGQIEPYPGLQGPNVDMTFSGSKPFVDHCMIRDQDASAVPLDTRSRAMQRLVTLKAPDTGIQLEISSTEPAFQFYTGEGTNVAATQGDAPPPGLLDGDQHGLKGEPRGPRCGIAIEPSRYVDCVNRSEWRGMVLLKKGAIYGSKSRYTAWKQ
ncbi:MAG: hypothetical protein Q9159_004438 [Coniocarpon cinnabarinum]